ncbi:MAG: hypothetical protein IPK26_12320 [Planctomycetes bacterium]|nr:hypothetical protein [Planctomycetota bacterium]
MRRLRLEHVFAATGVVIAILLTIHRCSTRPHPTWPRDQILAAIRFVESGDRPNPPDGDDGRAIGPYQIHEVYWRDATAFRKHLGGTYQDCRDRSYAERVLTAYMERYVPGAWAIGDAEIIARTHNGGPSGPTRPQTERYWQRVLARLSR